MGMYGYGPGVGGRGSFASDSGPLVPTYGGAGSGTTSGFQQRGFPESIRMDQLTQAIPRWEQSTVPDEGMMGTLDTLMRTPAYTLDRPFALAGQLMGMPEGETPLDFVSSFFEDLPFVGKPLSDLGKGAENILTTSQQALGSVLNAPKVQMFKNIAGMPDDADLPLLEANALKMMSGMQPARVTVRDVKLWAAKLGFTEQDWRDLAADRKGVFDFPDKNTAIGAMTQYPEGRQAGDLVNRLALDPVNIALMIGTGGISAGGILAKGGIMVGGALQKVGLTQRAALVSQSAAKATSGLTRLPALEATASATAIATGRGSAATLDGLSMFLKSAVRSPRSITVLGRTGRATPGGWYRRLAVGTTAGQVGINTVDALLPDDGPISDALRPVFDFAEKMGERKPLSNNDLFMLASLISFPARGMAGSGYRWARSKRDPYLKFSHTPVIMKALYPALEPKAGWDTLVARVGEESLNNAMQQVLKASLHERDFLNGLGGILARYAYASLSELGINVGLYAKAMERAVRRAMETGQLTPRDAIRGLERFTAGRGDVLGEASHGVERALFDPEDFIRAWEQWEPLARRTSEIFPKGAPLVPGITDTLLDDGVRFLKRELDIVAQDGKILGSEVARMVVDQPAIIAADGTGLFARTLTADGGRTMFEVKPFQDKLDELLDLATPRPEYMFGAASREGLVTRSAIRSQRGGRMLREDGTLDPSVAPQNGHANVYMMTGPHKRAQQLGVAQGRGYTEIVYTGRSNPKIVGFEDAYPFALEVTESKVLSATQIGMVERSSTRATSLNANTGLQLRYKETTTIGEMVDDIAIGLETTGAPRGTAALVGRDLIKANGLEPNGVMLRWSIGRDIPAAERDDIVNMLESFGDRVYVNDTVGFIDVIVPRGQNVDRAMTTATERLGKPARDAIHFRDVIANRKKVLKSDPPGSITLTDALARAKRTRKYDIKRSWIDYAGDANRGTVSMASGSKGARLARERGVDPSADRANGIGEPTRWEREPEHGGRVRVQSDEYEVVRGDAVAEAEYTLKLNDVGLHSGDPNKPFEFRAGDRLFITGAKDSGAVVRADGELILWLKSDATGRRVKPDADFGDVIAEASGHATWARVLDRRNKSGVSPVDHLANHGWAPVSKSRWNDDTIVYLIRDPDQLRSVIPPLRHGKNGGYNAVAEAVPELPVFRARAKARNLADEIYGNRSARSIQAAKDEVLFKNLKRLEELEAQMAAERARLDTVAIERQRARAGQPQQAPAAKTRAVPPMMRGGKTVAERSKVGLGETPVPPGMIRVYHYTRDPEAVLTGGLQRSKAIGETYGEPNTIWVSTQKPNTSQHAGVVEIHVRPDELDIGAPVRGSYTQAEIDSLHAKGSNLTLKLDEVPPDRFVAFADEATEGYRYAMREYGTNPTPAQLDNLRGTFQHADRDPRVAGYREYVNDIEAANAPVPKGHYAQSSTYRPLQVEYDDLIKATSTKAAKARRDRLIEEQFPPGNVKLIKGIEDDVDVYRPNLDESVEGNIDTLAPEEAAKVAKLEFDLRREGGYYDRAGVYHNGTDYTLKIVPKHGTPYYVDQGQAYVSIMKGRMALQDSARDKLTSKFAQAQDIVFGKVCSRELARQTRQEIYNELLNKGATPRSVNAFLAALRYVWETQPFQLMGAKPRRSTAALSPSKINAIARGEVVGKDGKVIFAGFEPAVVRNVGDFADVMQRTSSRTFRYLEKKYPASPGSGNLNKLVEQWYGKRGGGLAGPAKAARRAVFHGAFWYHMLRFILDPRWYAMNAYEAPILSTARYGLKSIKDARGRGLIDEFRNKPGKPIPQDPAIEMLSGKSGDLAMISPEQMLKADSYASGWMDQRNLYGYVANVSRAQRLQIDRTMLQKVIDDAVGGDANSGAVIRDLRAMFGEDTSTWIERIEKQMYDIDAKGVRATVMQDSVAVQLKNSQGPVSHLYDEFLEGLFEAHTKNYQDIVHMFHGNVNRSNIERMFNSPFLWWPLSYQLKAGKWVIDVMTKQFAGVYGHEMLGTAALATVLSKHSYFMEINPDYRATFENHPALWRTLGMLLPMTPFDMGVFMARWTRYSGSWIGAQLGLWDQDPSYPQDPYNFALRSLSLGPAFSTDVISDIVREF